MKRIQWCVKKWEMETTRVTTSEFEHEENKIESERNLSEYAGVDMYSAYKAD